MKEKQVKFVAELQKTLAWIQEQVSSDESLKSIQESEEKTEIWSGVYFSLRKSLETLDSVKNMAEQVYDSCSKDLAGLWIALFGNDMTEWVSKATKEQILIGIIKHIIEKFLSNYIYVNGLEFSRNSAASLAEEWFNFVKSANKEIEAYSPLENFTMDCDEIKLGNRVEIVKLDEEERKKLRSKLQDSYGHLFLHDRVFHLKIRKEFPITSPVNINDDYHRYYCILRLIKPEWITTGHAVRSKDTSRFRRSGERFIAGQSPVRQGNVVYTVFKGSEKQFQKDWKELDEAIPELDQLPPWLIRYLDSYQRKTADDTFIDLTIALESLFGGGHTALSHKIATRAANLLNGSIDEKKVIRKKIKDWYNTRSKIVHEGRPNITDFAEVLKLRECVRQIIRQLILRHERLPKANEWGKLKEKLSDELDFTCK